MFDTPNLAPLCVAPFIAVFIGVVFYFMGSILFKTIAKGTHKKKAWRNPIVIIISLAIIPFACSASVALNIGVRSPSPWFKPTTSNIVGKWELTPKTIEVFKDWYSLPVLDHELVFRDDGTFFVNQLPCYWCPLYTDKANNEEYITGSGNWYLGQLEGTERVEWTISAQFSTIDGQNDNRQMRFFFVGYIPPYTLESIDSANIIFRFIKK